MTRKLWVVAVVFSCVLAGRIWWSFSHIPKLSGTAQSSTFQAIVADEPQISNFSQSLTIEPVSTSTPLPPMKLTTSKYIALRYGDVISVTGTATAPRDFTSPNGLTFDYVDYLLKDGIQSVIKSNQVSVAHSAGLSLTGSLYALRRGFMANIRRVLGEPEASLAGGLVVGEKDSLGQELLNDFRKAGLIHIVVLSGYNITIIATTVQRILSFLPEALGNVLGGIGIILFGMLVGGGATVVRSCVMAVMAIVAAMIGRRYDPARALLVAASAMVLVNPLVILYDPSFQLSFVATAGLIWLSGLVKKFLQWVPEKFGLRELAVSTISTQIAVTPLLVHMVGQISILGIFANILVLPLIPITMLFISLTGLLGFVSVWLSWPLAILAHIFLSYELFVVTEFAKIPWVSLNF